mmetsp:Transcript_27571/g.40721  ORF Transcript_27571/g.40721 Transcript_27571/m.40721 type:complete len:104 (+) Transcript_27571:103-414(+)
MTASTRTNNKRKAVSFRSFVSVRKFDPITDPKMKHMLYYSESDLQAIKMNAKRQIMAYKLHKKQQLALQRQRHCFQTVEQEIKRPMTPDFESTNKQTMLPVFA